MDRLTIQDAARRLGISEGAARKRYERGTLEGEKGADGHIYVWVDEVETAGGELVAELRDRLRFVERQLEAERQAHAEARRIIGGLVQRIPELEAPAFTEPPRGSPETAGEGAGGGDVPPEPETPSSRSWWRRMFGFD